MNFRRNVLFHMKLEFFLNILWMIASGNSFLLLASNPNPFKFDLFNNFHTSKAFDKFLI